MTDAQYREAWEQLLLVLKQYKSLREDFLMRGHTGLYETRGEIKATMFAIDEMKHIERAYNMERR